MGACHACKSYFNKAVRYIDTILQRQKKKRAKNKTVRGGREEMRRLFQETQQQKNKNSKVTMEKTQGRKFQRKNKKISHN